MALVAGTVCVLAGLLRLGFVTELLSKPIRYGYMNGIALTVLVSQLPALFGFSSGGDDLIAGEPGLHRRSRRRADPSGRAGARHRHPRGDRAAQALPAGAGGAARGGRRRRRGGYRRSRHACRRAGARLAAAGPAGLRAAADPHQRHRAGADGRRRGGPGRRSPIPACCRAPGPAAPGRASTRTRRWWRSAWPTWRPGLFQGIPISGSASRTPVAEAAGAKTQLAGVVGALAVAVLLLVGRRTCSRHLPTRGAGGGGDRLGARRCSSSATCAASIASSAGSSGCRSPASSAWRCSGRSRASPWRS